MCTSVPALVHLCSIVDQITGICTPNGPGTNKCRHFEMQRGQSSQSSSPPPPQPNTHTHTHMHQGQDNVSPHVSLWPLSSEGGRLPEAFRARRTKMSRQVWCYFPSCGVQHLPTRSVRTASHYRTAQIWPLPLILVKCKREGIIIFLPEIKAWTGLITIRFSSLFLFFFGYRLNGARRC